MIVLLVLQSSTTFLDDETHLKLLMLPPIIRVTWLNNNQSERVEELIRAVANRFLPRGKWKVLARHWHFTDDQIEAIEHQFIGERLRPAGGICRARTCAGEVAIENWYWYYGSIACRATPLSEFASCNLIVQCTRSLSQTQGLQQIQSRFI